MENGAIQILTFRVGRETYGVDVRSVKEVIGYHQVYPVPRVHSCIRGITNVRGEVVPVIDLSCRFYGIPARVDVETAIVLVETRDCGRTGFMGVMIDEVIAVLTLRRENIETQPDFGARIRADFITGIAKTADEFVLLLDTGKVLDSGEMALLDAAAPIQQA